jgi:hypothetical protein
MLLGVDATLFGTYDPQSKITNLGSHLVQALLPAAKQEETRRQKKDAEAQHAAELKLKQEQQERLEKEAEEERQRSQRVAEEVERRTQDPEITEPPQAVPSADVEMTAGQ